MAGTEVPIHEELAFRATTFHNLQMSLPRIFRLALLIVGGPMVLGAETPSVDNLLNYLHADSAQRDDLLHGKILSTGLDEGTDKELAVGIVMFVPAPMEKLVDYVRAGKWFTNDRETIAFGELTEPVTLESFPADDAIRPKLLRRYESYRQHGLAGVEPYNRGRGKVSRPGDELKGALKESTLLADFFPEIHRALRLYPNAQPADAKQRFFWINQKVENRPTLILSHRTYIIRPEGAFMAERQFYVEHSYNSLFLLAGCLPVEGGTVIFYSNHTSTDQVAGVGSGLRHSIGRKQMRDEIVANFEQIRAAVTR